MSTFPVIRNDRDFLAAIVAGVPCHTVQDPDTLALSWQTDPCAVVRDECGNVSQVVRLMNATGEAALPARKDA